jgi:hypothetical protein
MQPSGAASELNADNSAYSEDAAAGCALEGPTWTVFNNTLLAGVLLNLSRSLGGSQ